MEIQKKKLDNSSKGIPVRPLEGYFRFRQEMMTVLTIEERTSENIVRLWNSLTPEQKTARLVQSQAELLQYQQDLALWTQAQQIPQQTQDNITLFNQDQADQRKIYIKQMEAPLTISELEQQETHNKKNKVIKKVSMRRTSKKLKQQNLN